MPRYESPAPIDNKSNKVSGKQVKKWENERGIASTGYNGIPVRVNIVPSSVEEFLDTRKFGKYAIECYDMRELKDVISSMARMGRDQMSDGNSYSDVDFARLIKYKGSIAITNNGGYGFASSLKEDGYKIIVAKKLTNPALNKDDGLER